ncbi:non-ribosomal peptide synthase/polyketide synthase [Pseudomonas sp. ITEM 17296]|uniref:non-ribosomal peptide synthetase n=1 Tax=Pseudomonas sp. ITEM 17296 TaxID=2790281 RepID=UPI00237FE654|nr:non-ribosomal peptide synthetase [Pseudomonas sp. ITEM 17296]MDE4537196.1 non-ribosomal peptide synthase/polyketide synthase [Pseudomonas sp. ITEM 17296]
MDKRNSDLVQRFVRLPLAQRKLFLEKLSDKGISLAQLPIPVVRHEVERPELSYAQQRQWFLWQWEPESAAYNIPTALKFKGALDTTALRRSFETLIARHETLRTTFHLEGEQAVQRLHEEQLFELSLEDQQQADEQAVRGWVEAQARQPFDLANGPLLRVKLLRLAEREHVLAVTLHHIVSDGWSMPVMVEELVRLYEGYSQGQEVTLPALPIQYADYAIWQRRWMEAGEQERQLAYWKEQLGDEQPVLELHTDRPRPAVPSGAGACVGISLPPELAASLKQCAQQQGVTLFMLLLASFQVLLHRYSGQADIRVGVPVANRNRVETERLIGFFVNTQVLRAEFAADAHFNDLLAQIKQRVLGAQAHQDLPFEQLVEALQPERSLSHSPLFQVMYNHQTQVKGERHSLPGLEVEGVAWSNDTAQFDLKLDTVEHAGGIEAALTYATDLFEAPTLELMAQHWRNLLEGIVSQPGQQVADLPLLSHQEQQAMVQGWNATAAEFPVERSIHSLIEAQVFTTPDAPALVFGEQTLSYAELNGKANQLAHKLRELGVGPDVLVGIAMERSLEMVIGLLGIVKAGGAYVPLDPEYPQDRLSYMFEDSGIALLLTQSHLRDALPIPAGLRSLDLDSENLDGYSDANPAIDMVPLNLAYVIYTSGSTGRPKGAGNSHQALVNRLWWMQKAYGLDASDSVLQKTPFSFDVSVWEFFWPLMTGARLVMAQPGAHRDPQLLVDTINQYAISTLHFVPSMLQAFMTHEAVESCRSLKRVVCSGEALPAELARQTLQRLPGAGLYNLYGPTEAAIDVTHWTCRADESISVPIGQPIDNLKTHILEGSLQPAVRGSAGELYLGGVGLARGYHQRPALTAERFVPDPFSDNGGRLYRTGDLARYNADGVIDYAGRLDHQVKIRGLRIELGEIEARLLELPAVQEAVVLAQDGPSGKQLVGYVVPANSTQDEAALRDSLREALKAGLPDYMVPAHLLLLGKLPVTPNGKLDRKALPQPDASLLQGEYVAPQSELEQQIAAIWADVLKLEKVGLTDNFFELGGDSIISLQVVSRARQQAIQFTPKELFLNQTVQALAAVARRASQSAVDQGPVTGVTPLLPIQHGFFEAKMPAPHHWNQSVLLAPSETLLSEPLNAALLALVEHHDALRLRFGAQATFGPPETTALLWVRPCADEQALHRVADEAHRSLSLEQGPLLRAVLVEMPEGEQRLLLVIHHLAVDGVSWRVLLEDLQQAYQSLRAGQALKLPAKTSSFKAWAEHLQAYAQGAELQAELGYWQAQLQGASDTLPCDHPQGGNQQCHAASVSTRLDRETTRKLLQEAPAAYRTQINDLLLSALARVVGRWTEQDEVLVRLEGHGREDLFDGIDLSRTVGWFTSMYPVKLSPQADVASSIKTIKEQLRAVPNKGLGYGLLRYLGGAEANAALAALPQGEIVFNYLGQFDGSFDEAGLFVPAKEYAGAPQDAQAPLGSLLALNGQVYGGELKLGWNFSREQFDEATIERLANDYAEELKALIAHCCQPEHRSVTPSDFPLAGLTQAQLDGLPVPPEQIADVYPLSPMQQGMLFHTLYEQEAGSYINQLRVDVDGLDVERFKQAWQAALDAHDILRSGFVWQGELNQAVQVVRKRVALPFSAFDWRAQPMLESALHALAESEQQQGFVLDEAPLLRLVLVRTDADRHHLICTHHHILMDGWSTSRLLGEVLQRYTGHALATQPVHYRDYIGWLQQQSASAAQTFWQGQLASLEEPTRLAQVLRSASAQELPGQGELHQVFDQALTQRIEGFARANRVTVNTLVQSAWLLLLQRYTGQSTVCFGATVAGRPAELPGVEEQIGLFINTLPVICAPRSEQSVAEWIEQVQASNLALREFEHTPLNEVQRWAGLGGEALFDTLMVFENYPVSQALQEGAPQGLSFGVVSHREKTNYPLTLAAMLGETLSIQYSYDRASWSEASIQRVSDHLFNLLQALIADASTALGELSLLGSTERQQILHEWNRSEAVALTGKCAHQLIEAQAHQRPDAVALVFDDQQLSYRELDLRSNQLARKLMEQGVVPNTLVGIAAERGLALAVALIAIHKAGAAYVPLDPDYPQDRLAYLIQDSGIGVLLADAASMARLPMPDGLPCVGLEQGGQWLEHLSAQPLETQVTADSLAYVIYTSGSTGMPKGVAIAHHALSVFCEVASGYSRLSAEDRVLQFATFSFDGFIEQFFPPLSRGACIVMRGQQLWDTDTFSQQIIRHGVTVADLPAAYWRLLALDRRKPEAYGQLKQIHVGGEAVALDGLQAWLADGPPAVRLLNTYGPTEATVVATTYDCSRLAHAPAADSGVPIGRALPGRVMRALDGGLSPTAIGVAGELYIGGDGCLARCYHQRPSLTAERFIPDPFDEVGGGRLYRTGDLGYFDEQGEIAYRGRVDHQVKVRGFRIELGEIEQHLQANPQVREAAVIAVDQAAGKQLCGYVVPTDEVEDESDLRASLKQYLKASLPDYMIPTYLVIMQHMPMTPSGKLDRKRLPAADHDQSQKDYVAPQGALEQQLAEIWAGVLKLEQVGVTDNFFELGGDSIISLQVVSRARQAGIQFSPKELFQHQTVQELAAVARRVVGTSIDQGRVTGSSPLTPIQQWFFKEDIAARHHWNQSVLLQPGEVIVAEQLHAALHAVLDHHDALRMRFEQVEGAWRAEFTADAAQDLVWVRTLAAEEDLLDIAEQAQRSLDLGQGPLLRALLVGLPDGSQRLLLVIHHLVVDGVSWRLLLEDLQQAYQALRDGQPVTLPAKTSSLKTWAEHLQHYAQGEPLRAELTYWQNQLQGASDELPCDHPQGGNQLQHATSVSTRLDRETTRQLLQDAPAAYRTQINDLLLTALARVISRWTQRSDVLVRLEGHGREDLFDDVDLSRTVGWFTSMYPVKLSPQADLAGSIKTIKEQLRAVPSKGLGYGLLRYLSGAQAAETLAALPQGEIVFNYLGQFDASFDEQTGLFVPAKEYGGASHDACAPLGSLLAVNGQVYGGELELAWSFSSQLFERSTVRGLADAYAEELKSLVTHCCQEQHRGVTPSDLPLAGLTQAQLDSLPVPALQVGDIYPLSPMQQGMLFYSAQGAEGGIYINQTSVAVEGLVIEQFVEAWNFVIARHDILRTGFWSAGHLAQPLQIVHRHLNLPIRVLDWRDRTVTQEALEALAASESGEAFDMMSAPLMRVILVRLDDHRMQLIWTRHHILMDGWSNARLLGEVFQAYHGKAFDSPKGRFGDYIRWLDGQSQAQLEAFWSSKLGALEGPTLLADTLAPKPAGQLPGHAALYLHWDAKRTENLRERAQRLRVTPNTLVQATWLLLLQRYTGQQTVCFGATVAGRPASLPGADEMLGLFINTLPVVQTPEPQQKVSDWLQQLQSYNLELRDHEHAALSNVQRWAGRPGQPLFDSILVFENYPVGERLQGDGSGTLQFGEVNDRDVTNYAMDLAVHLNDTFSVEFMYLRSRFTEAATEAIRSSFECLLSAMLDDPHATIGNLEMLSAVQIQQAAQRNLLQPSEPNGPRLAQVIARHAQSYPDAVAVICADQQLSYAQLEDRANRLAHHLIGLGARPEVTVGVALERSVEVIVAFLAVMKTGAAYVPLDIDYPQERLQWIVEDSAMHLLLTSSGLRERFPEVEHCVALDRLALAEQAASVPEVSVMDDNLAYLIYTSGSTGKPKGVAVSHGQIRMHCQAIAQLYEMDASTRELLFMSFAFDGAQERWLSTLSSGGCLIVRDNRLWTAEETLQVLHEQRIDIACFPPAYLQQMAEFAESQQQAAPPVRIYCFGGDAVPDALFELVKRTLQPQYLTNGYGPTETVVTPLLWKVSAQQACAAVYAPIGERVGQRTLHVLDQDLNPLPDGVAGELYIGGEGVARGYHQRAALTAERFVADPFGQGARLYRTGDRVRRRADGVIDFIGRLDNQLKIRGFRIEPGEIEARLRNLPEVRDAVVVAREGATGKQLVGYVVTGTGVTTPGQLRDALRAELPDYMVPAQLVLLAAMPLTPNGKIDRKALPAPELGGQRVRLAPRNGIERVLVQIWQDVLGVEALGIDDNFFELGGDSLRVLKMLSKVRSHDDLPIELKLRDVMAKPTIGELSGYSADEASLDPLLLLNTRVDQAPALFCLHAGFGTVFDYEPLARRLDGYCSVYGIQCRMLLDREWQDDSLQSMAIEYAQYIRQKQPEGPYRLAGWSLGGALAVLVTQELENQGQKVALLGLVDSFIPAGLQESFSDDWSQDLQGFLSVVLGGAKDDLVVPGVSADSDVVHLQGVIDQVRSAQALQSAYAEIDSAELAHTFVVAMRLKALSQQLAGLPQTKAMAHCWWAGNTAGAVLGDAVHCQVDAGHYDILKASEVIEGLAVQLIQEGSMVE